MLRDSDLVHFFEDGVKIPPEISQPLFVYLLAANSDGQTKILFGQFWTCVDNTWQNRNIHQDI